MTLSMYNLLALIDYECFSRQAVGLSDQQAVEPASRLLLALMDMYRYMLVVDSHSTHHRNSYVFFSILHVIVMPLLESYKLCFTCTDALF